MNTIQKGFKSYKSRTLCHFNICIPNLWLQWHCFTLFPEKLQKHFYMNTLLCCPLTVEFLCNKIIHPGGYWENSVMFHVIIVNIEEIQSCFTLYCKVLQKFLLCIYIYFIAETVGLYKKAASVLLKPISCNCTSGSHTSYI